LLPKQGAILTTHLKGKKTGPEEEDKAQDALILIQAFEKIIEGHGYLPGEYWIEMLSSGGA
jgi:hypothetical protein